MLSVFVGGAVMGWIFNTIGPDTGEKGGLGLTTEEIGFVQGTVGIIGRQIQYMQYRN